MKLIKIIISNNRFLLFALILISLVPLLDLFHAGFPITHDGQDHVARIANFYQNLKEGNLIPRWAGNLNWGYGHPILMFLYPMSSYAASFFHFLGFSLVDSTKIVFAMFYVLSGITMYLFVRETLDKRSAVIAGLLYIFAPYRFVDLYVRGAIGEHVAFVFPPLIFYSLLKVYKGDRKKIYIILGSFSLAGLILSHNAISLMFLPLIFLYALYLVFSTKNRLGLCLNYSLLILFGFGLSAFFWIPAFFEGKYTLRDIVTAKVDALSFSSFDRFFYSNWSYGGTGQLSVMVGVVQWITVFLSLPLFVVLFKKKNKQWLTISFMLFIFGITLLLMTQSSQFVWEKITILQKFQFPWRFLSVIIFITSLLGAIVFSAVPFKKNILIFSFILIIIIYSNKDYWHAKEYLYYPEYFYTQIYNGTTDTGESSPIWSVRFMEKKPKDHIEVIKGNATIEERNRNFTQHEYNIVVQERARIRENTLYFPGWNVFVDGKKIDIEFQDPNNRGLITFFLEKGKHAVLVRFSETKLRLISDIVSFSVLILISIYLIYNKKLWQQFR